MSEWLLSLGTVALSAAAFFWGRNYAESEKILAEKRRVYEEALRNCPHPNEAYDIQESSRSEENARKFSNIFPLVALYGSPQVLLAFNIYLAAFDEADAVLTPDSPMLHEAYKKAARAHNDLILEMRRDGLAFSFFGYRGASRIPKDAFEHAKRNSL